MKRFYYSAKLENVNRESTKILVTFLFFFFTSTAGARPEIAVSRVPVNTTEQKPQRIASTSLASDEILFDILANENSNPSDQQRILALSPLAYQARYSNIADRAQKITRRLSLSNDYESLLHLNPDLIIVASFNNPELMRILEKFHIPQIQLKRFNSLADIRSNIETVATVCHSPERAKRLLNHFDEVIAEAQKANSTDPKDRIRLERPSVKPSLLFLLPDGTTFGQETLIDDLIKQAGFTNVAGQNGQKGWFVVNQEFLLSAQPTYVLTIGEQTQEAVKQLGQQKFTGQLDAIKNGRVIVVPERLIFSTSHYVADALSVLVKAKQQWQKSL